MRLCSCPWLTIFQQIVAEFRELELEFLHMIVDAELCEAFVSYEAWGNLSSIYYLYSLWITIGLMQMGSKSWRNYIQKE